MNLPQTLRRWSPIAKRSDPFSTFVDRFFDEALPVDVAVGGSQKTPWLPLNISENEKAFVIALEAPGMDEKDINVQLMGNQLLISGEKKIEQEKKDKDWRTVECQYGAFQRSITLPLNVRGDQIEAVYRKGVLTLTIPKVEPTPSTKIKIKAE
jgi:HSP20 family protein